MSAALLLLRATQLGVRISDLYFISYGMLLDMFTELQNDDVEYDKIATQEDMDNF